MSGRIVRFLACGSVVWLACACSVTRHIPEGQYLLTANVIEVDHQMPKEDRISAAEMERFVRPVPNKRFLGMNLPVWVYTQSNPEKNNWWNRMLRRLGQAPVLLDTTLVEHSAGQIKTYMNKNGFYNSVESYRIDTSRHRKAKVIYTPHQGTPYRIARISYDFQDEFLGPVIRQDSAASLLRVGGILSENTLEAERSRIATLLKDQGYYSFSVNNISFVADSTIGNHEVNLRMIVKQEVVRYDEQGRPVLENNAIYRIRDIYIDPDYDPTVAVANNRYAERLDTVEYRGLNILYNEQPRVRKRILRQVVSLYPNYLYSAAEVQKTYDNIMRLGYFRSASVVFTPVAESGTEDNLVTFIGGDDSTALSATTSEKYLDCHIQCTPALRQSYKVELEGTTSSNFYGLKATLGYQNRNLFRGVELFEANVSGGYEFMRTKGKKGSFEVGGSVSMSFPRFITPFPVDRYHQMVNPRTRFELSINAQRRPYYNRTISGANFGYSWSNRHYSSFVLRPVDLNLIKMGYIDDAFFNSIGNPYVQNSYQSQLVAGISGSYMYNNQLRSLNSDINSLLVRFNWETAGNLISGLTHLFSHPVTGEDYYNLFGIRYAQYFRLDASVSNKLMLGARSSIVYRLYAGGGLSYGNSSTIPFDRLFYSGGSNSMRGWVARTLGPGTVPVANRTDYPRQVGNLKLEANLEMRFPVWGILHGAVFFDLGNVWFLRARESENPDGVFRFNRFYRQLGFNTGLGARFDLSFVVLRLDWGIKLHDPNAPSGQRWIQRFRISDTVLNFGVGYPF